MDLQGSSTRQMSLRVIQYAQHLSNKGGNVASEKTKQVIKKKLMEGGVSQEFIDDKIIII